MIWASVCRYYIYVRVICMCAGLDGVRVIYISLGNQAIAVCLYMILSHIICCIYQRIHTQYINLRIYMQVQPSMLFYGMVGR